MMPAGGEGVWTGVMPNNADIAVGRILRLLVLATFALALGACSKCDVPNWSAPRACHDGPAPQ